MDDKTPAPETPVSGTFFGDLKAWLRRPRSSLSRREQGILWALTFNPLISTTVLHAFTSWPRVVLFSLLIWLALGLLAVAAFTLTRGRRAMRGSD